MFPAAGAAAAVVAALILFRSSPFVQEELHQPADTAVATVPVETPREAPSSEPMTTQPTTTEPITAESPENEPVAGVVKVEPETSETAEPDIVAQIDAQDYDVVANLDDLLVLVRDQLVGRKFIALGAASALSILVSSLVCAQNPQGPTGARSRGIGHGSDFGTGRERFRSLSPEDRQRLLRNAERWMQMNAEERKIMRERENLRRTRLKEEAEAALRNSGLHLDQQKRAEFEARYIQERTKVEHVMRQELEAKRRQELPALVDKLKKEFQSQQSTTSTATPAASVKPEH